MVESQAKDLVYDLEFATTRVDSNDSVPGDLLVLLLRCEHRQFLERRRREMAGWKRDCLWGLKVSVLRQSASIYP